MCVMKEKGCALQSARPLFTIFDGCDNIPRCMILIRNWYDAYIRFMRFNLETRCTKIPMNNTNIGQEINMQQERT